MLTSWIAPKKACTLCGGVFTHWPIGRCELRKDTIADGATHGLIDFCTLPQKPGDRGSSPIYLGGKLTSDCLLDRL